MPISFSAGVDGATSPTARRSGFTPITTCTDLLRPGGYGRLPKYLENLEERMRALGVRTLGDFVVKAQRPRPGRHPPRDPGRPAAGRAAGGARRPTRVDLAAVLAQAGQAALYEPLVRAAAVLNTPVVLDRVPEATRATAPRRTSAVPRKIGSKLWLFDCINCDKCVPVCPNDSNFVYDVAPLRAGFARLSRRGRRGHRVRGRRWFEVKKDHQIANFQDFCNECGNCDTFCPEDGGPYVEKPRFFGSRDGVRRDPHPRRVLLPARGRTRHGARPHRAAREYSLEIDRTSGRAVFTDAAIRVELDHRERRTLRAEALPGAPDGHTLDLSAYLNLALAADGAMDPQRANPVNAGWL